MKIGFSLCGVALLALVNPALAAGEYYVVQNTGDKVCMITVMKPTTTTIKMISKSYDSLAKAHKAMKAKQVCAEKYYVVQNAGEKRCAIMVVEPTAATITVVGKPYDSLAEAEKAMKANQVCAIR